MRYLKWMAVIGLVALGMGARGYISSLMPFEVRFVKPDSSIESREARAPACFDLTDEEFHKQSSERGPLTLNARVSRSGANDLRVRVELWNISAKPQWVLPIDPINYVFHFEGKGGHDMADFMPLCVLRAEPSGRDFVRLEPGNALSAEYVLPGFYTKVPPWSRRDCEVTPQMPVRWDPVRRQTIWDQISSGWIRIP